MDDAELERLLLEQVSYYRTRAPEYDATSLEGQALDSGEDHQWLGEQDEALRALTEFAPAGRVLELAAGTGQWTRHLVRWANSITAVDASPEALAINRSRVDDPSVSHIAADIFTWDTEERYDTVFFAFWLSHVPLSLFDNFWGRIASFLNPHGRVFFIDERVPGGWTRALYSEEDQDPGHVVSRTSGEHSFRIVKVFHQPEDLARALQRLDWEVEIESTGRWLYHGWGRPAEVPLPPGT